LFVKKAADFINDEQPFTNVFTTLQKEFEPTLIVLPDMNASSADTYALQQKALAHCGHMQNRFAILDVPRSNPDNTQVDIARFREGIGTSFLNYGAAYYPWLKTSIVDISTIDYTYLDAYVDVLALLPEAAAQPTVDYIKQLGNTANGQQTKETHGLLLAASPTYRFIVNAMLSTLNLLPPSAALAGIYTAVDANRGVWKAPANVSVNMVNAPSINLSHEQQEALNVDPLTGKSINVIRSFTGLGTLVWGARTLDGNSQDWRYVNVRRTLIMIETSLKLATRAYVFEPNDANTWVTVKSMFTNFLTNLWKQGALAGATPEEAFDVQVGLGSTMTPDDILDGIMRISVRLAIVRPAEFIVITFQQQQQLS
jgi:phage tail sheath protein FI